jgi:hypothetical protein
VTKNVFVCQKSGCLGEWHDPSAELLESEQTQLSLQCIADQISSAPSRVGAGPIEFAIKLRIETNRERPRLHAPHCNTVGVGCNSTNVRTAQPRLAWTGASVGASRLPLAPAGNSSFVAGSLVGVRSDRDVRSLRPTGLRRSRPRGPFCRPASGGGDFSNCQRTGGFARTEAVFRFSKDATGWRHCAPGAG